MNDLIEKFKTLVEELASRLVNAVGGYKAPGVGDALEVAADYLAGKSAVYEEGGVYDPEFPLRLAVIQAALAGNPYRDYYDEETWLDVFKASPAAKKYLGCEEGWNGLIKEAEIFGDEDLGHQVGQINKLLKSETVSMAEKDWDLLLEHMTPCYAAILRRNGKVYAHIPSGGVASPFVEFEEACQRLGLDYEIRDYKPPAPTPPPSNPVECFHSLPGCEEQPEDRGSPDDDFDA